MASVLQSVIKSLKRYGSEEPTDGQLLIRFIEAQSEAAFAEIIQRHGAMVFGSARRLLGSDTEAEDVYQAAFLLLARKAKTLSRVRSLAGWLYGVTRRLSADVRKQARRRQRREQIASEQRQETERSTSEESLFIKQEVLQKLHLEMARLTHDLREPLVLQCLEGLSHQQIAVRLGVPPGTVASRLNRAKQLLKTRLMKRGVAPAMILALYGGIAQATLYPPVLALAAARCALVQSTQLAPLVTSGALSLFLGELRMVWFKQLQWAAAAVLVGALSLGAVAALPAANPLEPALPVVTHTTNSSSTPTIDDDLARLQGTWYCLSILPGGTNLPPPQEMEIMKKLQVTVQGEKFMVKSAASSEKASTIKLNTSSSPKRLELVNETGTTMRALYMVEGDVLVITFQDGNKPFPATLAVTKDLQGAMMILQKVPVESHQKNSGAAPARMDSPQTQSQNNMKQLGLAFHIYHDTHGKFPSNITDADGKPLLSWRVALLPYLDQNNLYKQFRLNEPWDSEHNKKLMIAMPRIFALEDANQKNSTTCYQSFEGKGTAFEPNSKLGFKDIVDGISNTIMFAEAAQAVPWTKPADIDFVPNQPLPKLGGHFGKDFQVVMLDGSVRILKQSVQESIVKAMITRAGGENPALDGAAPGSGRPPGSR